MNDLADRVCLVTGATGFVGSWLTDLLLERGARVRCLVRGSSKREFLPRDRIELAEGDVTSPASLPAALAGVDFVFHVAGLIKAPRVADFVRVNHLGTINLLEACRKASPSVARVIVVSSLAAAGPSEPGRPIDESNVPRPLSPYGRSKLLAEEAARAYGPTLPVTIVRPSAVYGPRDRATLQIIQIVARGVRPVVAPNGAISVVHVADLVDGILLAATQPSAAGRTYFLSSDDSPSPRELITAIGNALGRPGITLPVPGWAIRAAGRGAETIRDVTGLPLIFDRWKAEEIALAHWACSNALARAELGYCPRVSLATGLGETVRWYRKVGWL